MRAYRSPGRRCGAILALAGLWISTTTLAAEELSPRLPLYDVHVYCVTAPELAKKLLLDQVDGVIRLIAPEVDARHAQETVLISKDPEVRLALSKEVTDPGVIPLLASVDGMQSGARMEVTEAIPVQYFAPREDGRYDVRVASMEKGVSITLHGGFANPFPVPSWVDILPRAAGLRKHLKNVTLDVGRPLSTGEDHNVPVVTWTLSLHTPPGQWSDCLVMQEFESPEVLCVLVRRHFHKGLDIVPTPAQYSIETRIISLGRSGVSLKDAQTWNDQSLPVQWWEPTTLSGGADKGALVAVTDSWWDSLKDDPRLELLSAPRITLPGGILAVDTAARTQSDQNSPDLRPDNTAEYDINGDGVAESVPFHERPDGSQVTANTSASTADGGFKLVVRADADRGGEGEGGHGVAKPEDAFGAMLRECPLVHRLLRQRKRGKPGIISDITTVYKGGAVDPDAWQSGIVVGVRVATSPSPGHVDLDLAVSVRHSNTIGTRRRKSVRVKHDVGLTTRVPLDRLVAFVSDPEGMDDPILVVVKVRQVDQDGMAFVD